MMGGAVETFLRADDVIIDGAEAVLGEGSLRGFVWDQETTFLGSPWAPAVAVAVYLGLVWMLREIMSTRAPMKLKWFSFVHNMALSVGSAVLGVALGVNVGRKIYAHGLFYAICHADMFLDPRLMLFYYVNYLIKWYEFIDTGLLILKRKPLLFLHVYHHSATMVLTYTQIVGTTSVQWVPILLNLFVHTIMYYYYALSTLGIRVWWKKMVTVVQIIQFVLDLVACYYCTILHFTWTYTPWRYSNCFGSPAAAVFGCALLTSYLVLFLIFYRNTYKAKGAKAAAAAGNGSKEAKKEE